MDVTPVDKRNFYLALSVSDGQTLANSIGFAIPSVEVQQNELVDVVQRWMTLAAVGIIDQVRLCGDWMVEAITRMQDLNEKEKENTRSILVCFSVALLSHLIDNELLELSEQEDPELDVGRIERLLQFLRADEDLTIIIDYEDEDEEEDDE